METNAIINNKDLLIKFSNELNAIFENAAILLMLVNKEGRVVNINKTGLELLKKSKDSVLGLLGGEVFNCINAWSNGEVVCGGGKNCTHCSVRNLFTDTYLNGINHYKKEGTLEINNGAEFIKLELLISTSKINVNNENYILITIDDITKLKKQEKELVELTNSKDKFLSVLAHDLKNPFTTLMGFSELLHQNIRTYHIEKIEEHVGYIHNVALQTYNLLEDLLLWSKIHNKGISFNPKPFNLIEISSQVIRNQITLAQRKRIEISISEISKIDVYADENMFKTVLRNLLSNAIKFTNQDGKIDVVFEKRLSEVVLIISDNGIGMDEDKLANIWQFTPGQKSIGTAGESGTGFGLSICKEFVEKNGGRIWAESTLEKGSRFMFTIPLSVL